MPVNAIRLGYYMPLPLNRCTRGLLTAFVVVAGRALRVKLLASVSR